MRNMHRDRQSIAEKSRLIWFLILSLLKCADYMITIYSMYLKKDQIFLGSDLQLH